jgi:hypothetical protein
MLFGDVMTYIIYGMLTIFTLKFFLEIDIFKRINFNIAGSLLFIGGFSAVMVASGTHTDM